MNKQQVFDRYCELQRFVGWNDTDAEAVQGLLPLAEPSFADLVDDFYDEVERHPAARQVITGGPEQIQRLKESLILWLQELFSGRYDSDYVFRRWRIGYRHVEIGLDQVYTNVALSRLRGGLLRIVEREWTKDTAQLLQTRSSLNTLIDLDLALIEDAYQTEHMFRKQATERLALIGQVAGGIAHELRNPLNVVKTSVFYLLNSRNANPEKISQHLDRIERQVGIANEVITSLTNFARMPLANREPFDVENCLMEVLGTLERPDLIEFELTCSPRLPQTLADESQIRIVLSNLIRNAIEAMADVGTIYLQAVDSDSHVEVSVIDNGPGIDPERLSRVTEPFFSTKARGIGLGLAMAKAIVEKNGGRLVIFSQLGQGTKCTVHLQAVGR